LRRLRRRNEKHFLFVLLAWPEAGFEDFFVTTYPAGLPLCADRK